MTNKDIGREISEIDLRNLVIVRNSVSDFLKRMAVDLDKSELKLLDIAPQVHAGAKAYFKTAQIQTLDIDDNSGADFIADLCVCNENLIPSESFDVIVCTEVLEHTLQPFDAVNELWRLLKPGGIVLLTVPFNLRIHGPLPDCWRFTEHGLKKLFQRFDQIELETIEDTNRWLMPVHYRLKAKKPLNERNKG